MPVARSARVTVLEATIGGITVPSIPPSEPMPDVRGEPHATAQIGSPETPRRCKRFHMVKSLRFALARGQDVDGRRRTEHGLVGENGRDRVDPDPADAATATAARRTALLLDRHGGAVNRFGV